MKIRPVSKTSPRSYDNARREQQASENRSRILDAAASLLGTEEGELTVPGVAHKAGLSVPTVYRNFPTRDALLEAVDLHVTQRLGAPARPFEDVDAFLRELPQVFAYFHANQTYIRAAIRARNHAEVARAGRGVRDRAVAKMLERELAHLLPADAHAVVAVVRILSGSDNAIAMFDRWGFSAQQVDGTMRWLIGLMLEDLRKGSGPGDARDPSARKRGSRATKAPRG